VLAGPDPSAIQDAHQAREVLDELQEDVAILLLPMQSLEENALMVNALQGHPPSWRRTPSARGSG
jgi:hypothetical protein